MMQNNRFKKVFSESNDGLLNIYFTAGFPAINDTIAIAKELDEAGADMLEIGMPFSDPLADGPVIQAASKQALDNGMSLEVLFEQLNDLRTVTDVPVLLMGYINPVLQMGVERFIEACASVGVDGVILPDLPLELYEQRYQEVFEKHGIANVFLVTPDTSEERIRKIESLTNAFVYMVSSASTTGNKESVFNQSLEYFKRIEGMSLNVPRLIGFNIKDKETYDTACTYSDGAIIGSQFVRELQKEGDRKTNIESFIKSIKG